MHLEALAMSSSDSATTCAPRLGSSSTSPSAASTRNASRSGVRETPSCSQSTRSFRRAPGARSPSMIMSRSRSASAKGSAAVDRGRAGRARGRVLSSIAESVVSLPVMHLVYLAPTLVRSRSRRRSGIVSTLHIATECRTRRLALRPYREVRSLLYTKRRSCHASGAAMIPLTAIRPDAISCRSPVRPTCPTACCARSTARPSIIAAPSSRSSGKTVLARHEARLPDRAADVVIYPASGTGAWEAALVNTLSPGDTVLMAETGHFATLWKKLAEAARARSRVHPRRLAPRRRSRRRSRRACATTASTRSRRCASCTTKRRPA